MIVTFKDDAGRNFGIQCDAILAFEPEQVGYTGIILARTEHKVIVKLELDKLLSIIQAAHEQAGRAAQRGGILVPGPLAQQ